MTTLTLPPEPKYLLGKYVELYQAVTDEWQTSAEIGRKAGLAPGQSASHLAKFAVAGLIERRTVSVLKNDRRWQRREWRKRSQ